MSSPGQRHGQRPRRSGAHPVVDWADLLQPQLQKKVACTDAPREYIGLALKTLSLPLNASARDVRAAGLSEADVVDAVRRVRSQVRVFVWEVGMHL